MKTITSFHGDADVEISSFNHDMYSYIYLSSAPHAIFIIFNLYLYILNYNQLELELYIYIYVLMYNIM